MLKLDAEGARGVVNQIAGQISALQDAAAQINNAVTGNLPSFWEGVSASKAQATYASDYQKFLTADVPQMVEALNKYINDCIQAIEACDQGLAG